jgi:hypothetical protein
MVANACFLVFVPEISSQLADLLIKLVVDKPFYLVYF